MHNLVHMWRFWYAHTQWVSLVEQELLTIPEHLSSPPVVSWVSVARSVVF